LATTIVATLALAAHSPSARAGAVPASPDDATILHVLNRLGFGPRPGDVDRIRQVGLSTWIDRQLHPDRIADDAVAARLAGMSTLRMTSQEIAEKYLQPLLEQRQQRRRQAEAPPKTDAPRERLAGLGPALRQQQVLLQELVAQKLLLAVYSERQLQEVLVDFWFNHFNVFANKGLTRMYLTAYERDAIRPHVLGRFRDLLRATAKSPAMLFYLDNVRSADPAFAAKAKADLERARPLPDGFRSLCHLPSRIVGVWFISVGFFDSTTPDVLGAPIPHRFAWLQVAYDWDGLRY
jgi:uncharacterized protein (DUF1800 family)